MSDVTPTEPFLTAKQLADMLAKQAAEFAAAKAEGRRETIAKFGSWAFGAALMIYGMIKGNDQMVEIGGGVAGLGSLGLQLSRGMTKFGSKKQ